MKRAAALLLLSGLAAAPAVCAQPVPPKTDSRIETVIVTGEKPPEEKAHDYIQTYTAPSFFLGKITRWTSKKYPICPQMVGLTPSFDAFVTARIRQVAKMVGAPVNPKESCSANVLIIITSTPQALLDDIHANHSNLLGCAVPGRPHGQGHASDPGPV